MTIVSPVMWLHRHWHNGWEGTEYRDLLQAFRDEVTADSAALPHIIWKEMVATHYRLVPHHSTPGFLLVLIYQARALKIYLSLAKLLNVCCQA